MGEIGKHVKAEIKLLPYTLGKLAGGAMAVIGFPAALFSINKNPDPSFLDILPFIVLGFSGIIVFLYFSRLLANRMDAKKEPDPTKPEKKKISIVAWIIFAIFIGLFVSFTFIISL